MMSDVWLTAFAINEQTWLAPNTSVSDKQNAWRTQKLLFAHATCDLPETAQFSVLNDHQSKMEKASCTGVYMQNRLDCCLKLLGRSRRRRKGSKPVVEWSTPPENYFEKPCHGVYESCKERECVIKTAQKPTEKIKDDPKPSKLKTNETPAVEPTGESFITAWKQLELQKNKDYGDEPSTSRAAAEKRNVKKKSLGGRGRRVHSPFKPRNVKNEDTDGEGVSPPKQLRQLPPVPDIPIPDNLAHLDESMVKIILAEMRDPEQHESKACEDIAGLAYAKSTFLEAIIHPQMRPDLFQGLRRPYSGLLLFGPPGTGKTMIARWIASQSRAVFFNIHPSTLIYKWVGEGEKLVRTLFAVAREYQTSIIFLDEVVSLLSQRSDREHESSRRMKNEFFIHLDDALANTNNHVIILGATNRPEELDDAIRRRFPRRLYIPLPPKESRVKIIESLIKDVSHNITNAQIKRIAEFTEGYSGADMTSLCKYAAIEPIRSITTSQMRLIKGENVDAVTIEDFEIALTHITKSVSDDEVERYVAWNEIYGREPPSP